MAHRRHQQIEKAADAIVVPLCAQVVRACPALCDCCGWQVRQQLQRVGLAEWYTTLRLYLPATASGSRCLTVECLRAVTADELRCMCKHAGLQAHDGTVRDVLRALRSVQLPSRRPGALQALPGHGEQRAGDSYLELLAADPSPHAHCPWIGSRSRNLQGQSNQELTLLQAAQRRLAFATGMLASAHSCLSDHVEMGALTDICDMDVLELVGTFMRTDVADAVADFLQRAGIEPDQALAPRMREWMAKWMKHAGMLRNPALGKSVRQGDLFLAGCSCCGAVQFCTTTRVRKCGSPYGLKRADTSVLDMLGKLWQEAQMAGLWNIMLHELGFHDERMRTKFEDAITLRCGCLDPRQQAKPVVSDVTKVEPCSTRAGAVCNNQHTVGRVAVPRPDHAVYVLAPRVDVAAYASAKSGDGACGSGAAAA